MPRASWGRPARVLDEIDSTNSEGLRWADEGAPEGAIVLADHQTGGRGRWGRSWHSAPGRALQFSVVLRPTQPAAAIGLLTTIAGLAAAEGIEAATGLACGLKWPNDVTVEGRKLAGILVETRVTGDRVAAAVAGIGVNVAYEEGELPSDIARRATSLALESEARGSGTEAPPAKPGAAQTADAEGRGGPPQERPGPSRAVLLGHILERLEHHYPALGSASGAEEVVERAAARSEVLGREVRVRLADGRVVEGLARALAPSGGLVVETPGELVTVDSGEVERMIRR